jgi:ribulose-5-phosphate 4-epimerase/fuculose-1-phosphate aldolase
MKITVKLPNGAVEGPLNVVEARSVTHAELFLLGFFYALEELKTCGRKEQHGEDLQDQPDEHELVAEIHHGLFVVGCGGDAAATILEENGD